jgi:hypothetical protein
MLQMNNIDNNQKLDDILFGKFKLFDVSFIHKISEDFNLRTETKAIVFGLLNRLDYYYKQFGRSIVWFPMVDNYIKFIEQNFGVEEAAIAINGALQAPYNLPIDEEDVIEYKRFLERNSHYYGM